MTARRYWGLALYGSNNTSIGLTEIEMRETAGGADVTTGGTAYASSNYNLTDHAPAGAFDGITVNNRWNSAINSTWDVKVWYDCVTLREINEVVITARNDWADGATVAPHFAIVISSPDGITWTPEWFINCGTWTLGQVKTFTRPTITTDCAHWMIWCEQNNGQADMGISELALKIGGTNMLTGGTAYSIGTTYSGWEASKALDGNNATAWVTQARKPAGWGYTLASPIAIPDTLEIRTRSDYSGGRNQAPTVFRLLRSTDGVNFVEVKEFWATWPTDGETKVFTPGAAYNAPVRASGLALFVGYASPAPPIRASGMSLFIAHSSNPPPIRVSGLTLFVAYSQTRTAPSARVISVTDD